MDRQCVARDAARAVDRWLGFGARSGNGRASRARIESFTKPCVSNHGLTQR